MSNGRSNQYIFQVYGTKYQSCEKLYLIYPKDGDIKESLYHYFSENDSKDKKLPLEILFFDLENPSLDFQRN